SDWFGLSVLYKASYVAPVSDLKYSYVISIELSRGEKFIARTHSDSYVIVQRMSSFFTAYRNKHI
ncbi:hypothetical protein AB4369_27240, partial [Vibrio sp. 10N.261.49.A5]